MNMKIKHATTCNLTSVLKLLFNIYLPYMEGKEAQELYDKRNTILEELLRRNKQEYEVSKRRQTK